MLKRRFLLLDLELLQVWVNVLDLTLDYMLSLMAQMLVHLLHHHQQVIQQTLLQQRGALVTDIQGKVEFSFRIPEYRFAGQSNIPKFRTGDVDFRLTSSETNIKIPPSTVGQVIYTAKGIVNTTQQTIEATRNATVVQETVTQTQSVTNSSTQLTRIDPLTQTFLISEDGGCFISSVDLFFSEKDTNLPVWVELREVLNGYLFQHLYHLVEKF